MIKYVKLTILNAFMGVESGFTVSELALLLNMTQTAIGKRLKAYHEQRLLIRIKECKQYRYTITSIGKSRMEYLQKQDNPNV